MWLPVIKGNSIDRNKPFDPERVSQLQDMLDAMHELRTVAAILPAIAFGVTGIGVAIVATFVLKVAKAFTRK